MDFQKFLDWREILQPQLLTLIYTTILLIVLSIIVYVKVKNVKPDEAPKGVALIAEQYVGLFNNEFQSATEGKIDRVGPYIFTLFSFLLVGNTAGLIGLEPIVLSYSVPLTLGLISWMGIYVFGIIYQKLSFFKRFQNPIDLIGQFSPLISISFRIFGNILGGAIIIYMIYWLTYSIWSKIPVIGDINVLGMVVAPVFHLYFDAFGAIIQAYVFALLTGIYWTQEVNEGIEAKKHKIEKRIKKQEKNILNKSNENRKIIV